MQRKKIATISRLNGYGPEKGFRRASVFKVNGYAPEKSRFSSQFVHLSILFTGERTSNHGIFMPCWGLENPSESERVWGGLCNSWFGKMAAEGLGVIVALIIAA